MARRKDGPAAADAPVRSTHARLILKHKRALMFARAEKDQALAAIKARIKAAKDDGVPVKALDAALKLGKLEPAEARQLYVDTGRMFEALYPGVLAQKDLFDAVEPATDEERAEVDRAEIELEGVAAGRLGETGQRDHRHPPGTAEAQAFERGWLRGAGATYEANEAVADLPDARAADSQETPTIN